MNDKGLVSQAQSKRQEVASNSELGETEEGQNPA